jgi:hypothetical protein
VVSPSALYDFWARKINKVPSLRLAVFVVATLVLAGCATGPTDVADKWRYVPASSEKGAAAELGEMGEYGFRIRCLPTRHELFFEYFPGDGGPGDWTEEARNSGIDLILYYPASNTETSFVVRGPVTGNSLTGTLPLTADLSDQIAEAPQLMLYGENGPSNVTFGGAAVALRRVANECAPPRTGRRLPRIERGREKSDR